jgi:hypothetical protein
MRHQCLDPGQEEACIGHHKPFLPSSNCVNVICMALQTVHPFRSEIYLNAVSDFIYWAANHVERTEISGRTGWISHLHSYEWKGQGWREGVNARLKFHDRITNAQSHDDFDKVIRDILDWGEMKPFDNGKIRLLRKSLEALDALRDKEHISMEDIFVDRIASSSKIYEMHDPNTWMIYDSRVSRGLASLVTAWWETKGHKWHKDLLRFPWPPGRGIESPPHGFPRVARTAPNQARLGFIYASWLSGALASKIREITRTDDHGLNWETYHVEMILFMLGKFGTGSA